MSGALACCTHIECSLEAVSYAVCSCSTAHTQDAPSELYPMRCALAVTACVPDASPKLYPLQYALAVTAYVPDASPKLYPLQYALACSHIGRSSRAVSYAVSSCRRLRLLLSLLPLRRHGMSGER